MKKNKKITVIGAGNVGATCAQRILESSLADVILLDVVEGLAEGKALDMNQSAHIIGFNSYIKGSTDFNLSEGSDVIVITAGLARKPGMSRDDLAMKNATIMKDIVSKVSQLSPNAVLIIVTNPLDVMCYVARKYSGFSRDRIIGMAGELDGARFIHFVRENIEDKTSKMTAMVLGTHGDAMVPLIRFSTVGDEKVESLLSSQALDDIVEKTQKGGAQIVGLLKTGSAYYAPSAAAFVMARSIILDLDEVYCCSVFMEGEYGITNTYCGVPVRLGSGGVKEILKIDLNDTELELLQKSSKTIKENIDKVVSI